MLSKHGEFICVTIVIRIFADLDSITPLPDRLKFVGVVDRFADPESTTFVPIHRDRLALESRKLIRTARIFRPVFIRLFCPQRHAETLGNRIAFDRCFSGEWILHLGQRCALSAPLSARRVVGDLGANIDKRKYLLINCRLHHFRIVERTIGLGNSF